MLLEMRSKGLDSTSSSELHHAESSSAQCQLRTSGRHHRWFNVMQGIRRSLDLHFKSHNKIDSAFASTLRLTSATDKLRAMARALSDTGLVDFCSICVVQPVHGTFGVIALSGSGGQLFPPLLGDEGTLSDSCSQSFLNVFTRCVFQVKDSNWCVEDVVISRAPWYYDCTSAVNGFGLPQDGSWLRRVGMRSVLALPCIQGNDVTGVLTVASKQKSLDHLLLRKLEELCFKITPVVTSAVLHFSPLLCHRRAASRFESISDFAHAALGEMLNLDRALAASVSKLNRSADILHATEQQLPQQQSAVAVVGGGSAKGRRTEERFVFDASVAVAAAAAAGFTWTTPAAVSAAEAVASIPAIAPSHQHHQYDSQPAHGIDTFCTALTEPASSSVLLISDLPSVLLQPDARFLALPSSEFMTAVTPLSLRLPLTPVCESAPSGSNTPTKHCQQEQPSLCVALPTPLLSSSAVCTQHISSSRSLPDRATSETSVVDFLRTLNASPCHGMVHAVHAACSPYHQQVQNPPHQPSVFEPVFAGCGPPSSSDRNTSRSTRSISCLEFSGGLNEVREELGSLRDFVGCIPNAPSRVAVSAGKSDAVAAAAVMVAAASPANAPFTKISNVTDGMMPDGRGRTPKPQLDAAGTTPDKTPSNCCSAYGCLADGYLIDSGFVEEEVTAHWQGSGGGMMTSPSAWCSMNMESRDMRRGAPLEPSLGAVGSGAVALAAAPAPTTRPTFANLTAACGSSCATTYTISDVNSGSTNTTTTFGFVRSSCLTANTALCGTINAHLSDGVGVSAVVEGDCGEVRTSLHGLAKSRWSRESAAAAAAVWNNEAAEAFADALDFTSVSPAAGECLSRMHRAEGGSSIPALDEDDDDESGIPLMSSYWTARATEPPTPAMVSFPPRRLEQRTAAPALGGLYGIRESGSMSSVHSSLEFSDSDDDDGGVMVLNLVSNGGGGGSAVMLSSGLGAEAFRRQHCEVRGSSGCGGGSTDSQPMSKSGISVILASSYNKAGVVGTTAERVAVCG